MGRKNLSIIFLAVFITLAFISFGGVIAEEILEESEYPPILSAIGNKIINENDVLKIFVVASDFNLDKIDLTISNLPQGATFTDEGNGKGTFSWRPNYNQSGIYAVKFYAKDETGLEDVEEISILVKNVKEPPKFSDSEVCLNKNDSIRFSIKEPRKGEEFEIGEIIEGSIKINNDFDDDVKFDVKIYLYDINEEESVENFDEDIKIKEGKSDEVDFSLEIPSDIDNENFAIYVYVEGEDECNSAYIEIEITRKEHEVVIKDIIAEESASPGNQIQVKVKIENLGLEDEDVFIMVEIPSLNISQKSKEIEIEKYGDKNKETETFYLSLPFFSQFGYYDIKATVVYDDGKDTEYKGLIITGSSRNIVKSSDKLNAINLNSKTLTTIGNQSQADGKIILSKSSTFSKTKGVKTPLLKSINTLNLGVEEVAAKEYHPHLSLQFDGEGKVFKSYSNQWVILAIILGLLILVIIFFIFYLKRNPY